MSEEERPLWSIDSRATIYFCRRFVQKAGLLERPCIIITFISTTIEGQALIFNVAEIHNTIINRVTEEIYLRQATVLLRVKLERCNPVGL